ncbi:MAG: molybdenum cofactor biosynthesis protein MoaE [Nitriliruptoraceae bacterium]
MDVDVRLFGGLASRARRTVVHITLPDPARVADLRAAVASQVPEIAGLLDAVKVAVDLEVAGLDVAVTQDSEVALLPPVAGGSDDDLPGDTHVDVPPTLERVDGFAMLTGLMAPPIDVESALAAIVSPSVGGTVLFLGTVRDHAPDLDGVVGLDYSVYPDMARRVLADTARAVAVDHPEVTGIALLHAVGELTVGEHTILVACASAHRAAAFAACEDALERVKRDTPVWKRERTMDGAHRWVGLPDA